MFWRSHIAAGSSMPSLIRRLPSIRMSLLLTIPSTVIILAIGSSWKVLTIDKMIRRDTWLFVEAQNGWLRVVAVKAAPEFVGPFPRAVSKGYITMEKLIPEREGFVFFVRRPGNNVIIRIAIPLAGVAVVCIIPLAFSLSRSFILSRVRLRQGRCVRCGYSLTGNVSKRCPECGTEV